MCIFCQILHFIFKINHNFESYQNMLSTLGFCFLYHKLQLFLVSHAHFTPFTYGKGFLKKYQFEKYFEFKKNQIQDILNCECFSNLGRRLL